MTPKEAQFKGANYLVIGRPILSAKNPSLAQFDKARIGILVFYLNARGSFSRWWK